MPGQQFDGVPIRIADNFRYTDPIDQSITENQGLRLLFEDGSRIIFRLSGTGTKGATIRVYYEHYRPPTEELNAQPQQVLSHLFNVAQKLGRIHEISGRTAPDVIT